MEDTTAPLVENDNFYGSKTSDETEPALPGAPTGWRPPSAPDGQKPKARVNDEPDFKGLDNPGK